MKRTHVLAYFFNMKQRVQYSAIPSIIMIFVVLSVGLSAPVFSFDIATGTDIVGKTIYTSSCKAPYVIWRGYDPTQKKTLFLSRLSDGNLGRDTRTANDLKLGNTRATPVDTKINLDVYPMNSPLEFKIYVHPTKHSFYTGPATSNVDGVAHALVQDAWIPWTTLVSFEDDHKNDLATFAYDDLSVSVSYTSTSKVTDVCLSPDP